MPDMLTTKDSFPVVDITHKPKRTQRANIQSAIREEPVSTADTKETNVPQSVTIERAISFYESNAQGDYAILYSQTAKWLRDFMSKSVPAPSNEEVAE